MKSLRLLALLAVLPTMGQAQTAPTRSTPCSPTTAWNAACLSFTPPTTYSDGLPIASGTVITYRVEEKLGATGTWATIATAAPGPRYLATNLAAGVHYFRIFSVVAGAESDPSNEANRGASTGVPSAPVLTIAMVIRPGAAPLVVELTAKRDGGYRCRVLAAPKGLDTRGVCQADVS